MEMNEFLTEGVESVVEETPEELDVQKAVVESLAAEKVQCDEQISSLRKDNYALQSEVSRLKEQIEEMRKSLGNVGDVLAKNTELNGSNQVALLERNTELDDRFTGESRDHVLEVIKEARDAAEKDGRLRRAQILEGVLLANEPIGELDIRRKALEKLFTDNGNIVSGPVIEELKNKGIAHKNGEEYLLPAEIIKRTY